MIDRSRFVIVSIVAIVLLGVAPACSSAPSRPAATEALPEIVDPAPAPTRASRPWSLESLDSAAGLLMAVVDGAKFCSIRPAEASSLLDLLHARIDQETALAAVEDPPRAWARCQAECHCGAWSTLAENRVLSAGPPAAVRAAMYHKASVTTPAEIRKCSTATARWFCKGKLLRELRRELR